MPKRIVWRVVETPWMVQISSCCSCAALSWSASVFTASLNFISTTKMLRVLRSLRSFGWCCLGKVDPLMAGGAAAMPPVSLSCPLPLRGNHPTPLHSYFVVFCLLLFAEMEETSIAFEWLEAIRFCLISREKRATNNS